MPAKRTASRRGFNMPGRRLIDAVTSEFELTEHELSLLHEAAHVRDTLAELQQLVDREGAMVPRSFEGPRVAHPALTELRQQRLVYARLIGALGLPVGLDDDAKPGAKAPGRGRAKRPKAQPDETVRRLPGMA